MLERWWTSKTEAGRKVKAIEDGLAGGLARDALDEQDMKAYLDMREIFSQLAWSPEGLERRAKYEAQFRKDNLLEGFYFQEQCAAVWGKKDQNRRCVPARNQKPYQRGQDHCQRCGLPASISRQA